MPLKGVWWSVPPDLFILLIEKIPVEVFASEFKKKTKQVLAPDTLPVSLNASARMFIKAGDSSKDET